MIKKALLLTLLLCVAAQAQFWEYPDQKPWLGQQINWSHPLTDGLAGFWIFNENDGKIVQDVSGNGNDGTLESDTHFVSGKFGPCLSFGNGDYVNVANPKWDFSDFTVLAWIKVISEEQDWHIVSSAFSDYYRMTVYRRVDMDRFQVLYGDGISSDYSYFGSPPIQLGKWQQWVLTKQGGHFEYFMDGMLLGTTTRTDINAVTGTDVELGSNSYNSPTLFDHIMVYNRALTAREISDLYANPFQMFEPVFPLWWYGGIGGAPPSGGQVIFIY